MAESVIQKGSGGAASNECTAGKAQVLAGYTAVTKDSGDEPVAGTMAANGNMTAALNCGQSKVIPAGYTPGGTVTANSLASQTGGVTAEDKYVLNGKTYWRDGVKRTGSMTVASVASFSVAPYSTSQVLATWKNPGRGPYSGIIICAKTGGYPANINDGRVYTGVGSNSAVNGTSSQVIGGLAAGTTYYFRIWVYCTCSAGDQYSGYLQATCAPTAHGRASFTSSGTWTVPVGVRSINVHCTGGGGGGFACDYDATWREGGTGGGGGYTSYKNGIAVSPGQQVVCGVGAGSIGLEYGAATKNPAGDSYASISGSVIVLALGGNKKSDGSIGASYHHGGSAGGFRAYVKSPTGSTAPQTGASNGGSTTQGTGQGSTTKEFGTGTLYSGGGGGGGCARYYSGAEQTYAYNGAPGGAGGGGMGGGTGGSWGMENDRFSVTVGAPGSAGTGGGGGGGSVGSNQSIRRNGGNGGSGNVIITW